MKKRLFGLFAALVVAIASFALVACKGDEEDKPTPVKPSKVVTIEMTYTEESGVLGWNAVEGATKYVLKISNPDFATETKETAETSAQLLLKRGINRLSLSAVNADGKQVGVGSKNIALETDFGAPAAVTAFTYDADSKTLGWAASEGAVKYVVSATSWNNEDFEEVVNAETTTNSYVVDLTRGVYEIAVVAVNDNGARSLPGEYEHFSYVDENFNTEISDGVYKLFDFDDENVIEIIKASDYKAWSASAILPEFGIVNKHEKDENNEYDAADCDFDSKVLKVSQNYPADGNGNTYTSTATIRLKTPLENWGRIYLDVFRTPNPPFGIVLTDVDGRMTGCKTVQYNHTGTNQTQGTVSFCRSEFVGENEEFGAIKEISVCVLNAKGGKVYVDNIRYDLNDIGYFGEGLYKRSTETFAFDAVYGATSYELTVDDSAAPIVVTEPTYTFETGLTTGAHTIKVKAINGESAREQTYSFEVGDRVSFNYEVTSNPSEYVLADFNTVEFREYLARGGAQHDWSGEQSTWTVEDGKLNASIKRNWGNSYIQFDFLEPIDIADVYAINITYKSSDLLFYLVDENGAATYWYSSAADYATSTIKLTDKSFGSGLGALTGDKIVAFRVSARNCANPVEVLIDQVSYYKNNGLGLFGNASYSSYYQKLTFDAVSGAESYGLYFDDATTPVTVDTAECENDELVAGAHIVRVVAKKGESFREKTYSFTVYAKPAFNVETSAGSGEYKIVDFTEVANAEFITKKSGSGAQYSFTDNGLNYTNTRWGDSYVIYTMPEEIAVSDIASVTFKFTHATKSFAAYVITEEGLEYLDSAELSETQLIFSHMGNLNGTNVKSFVLGATDYAGVITVSEIGYVARVATEGEGEAIGSTNEYLLASFDQSGYYDNLEVVGTRADWSKRTRYSISDGKLVIDPLVDVSNQAVKFTFSEPIDKSSILKFTYTLGCDQALSVKYYDEDGNSTNASWLTGKTSTDCNIYVIDAYFDASALTVLTGDKIAAIAIVQQNANNGPVTVKIDKITYTKVDDGDTSDIGTTVSGTTDEYVIASFNSNKYERSIATWGQARSWGPPQARANVLDGALTVQYVNSPTNKFVKYVLPTALDIDDVYALKFKISSSTGNVKVVLISENDAGSGANDMGKVIKISDSTTTAVEKEITDFSVITGNTIVAIGFTTDTDNAVTVIDQITYVAKAPVTGFNTETSTGSGEYLLANFDVNGYYDYLSVAGDHANWGGDRTEYSLSDGKLVIDELVESGYNRVMKYTFPEQINKADIAKFTFTLTSTQAIRVWYFDENGDKTTSNQWLCGTVPTMTATDVYPDFDGLTGSKISAIAFALHNYQNRSVVNVDKITYEFKNPVTGFNDPISTGSTEYLLADFNVNGYRDYLSKSGNANYNLADGKLVGTSTTWGSEIDYTFPSAINLVDVSSIKFSIRATGATGVLYLIGLENGTKKYYVEKTFTSAEDLKTVTYSGEELDTAPDSIVGVRMLVNNTTYTLYVDQITYVKANRATLSGFNALVSGSTTDYLLADFDRDDYNGYFRVGGQVGRKLTVGESEVTTTFTSSISEGKLAIETNEDWGNGYLNYRFPTAISDAYVIKFNGFTSSKSPFVIVVYQNTWKNEKDEDVNTEAAFLGSAITNGTITYTVPSARRGNPIVGVRINAAYEGNDNRDTINISVDSITYEKVVAATGFNTLVAGTENEYMLADFSQNGYADMLTTVGSAKFLAADGKLTITNASWGSHYVTFTLPTAIDVSEIESIKVYVNNVAGNKHAVLTGITGANVSGEGTFVAYGGSSGSTFSVALTVAKDTSTNKTFAENATNLTSFGLSSSDSGTPVEVLKVTYVKKTAATEPTA